MGTIFHSIRARLAASVIVFICPSSFHTEFFLTLETGCITETDQLEGTAMAETEEDPQLEYMNEQAVAGKWSYLRSELNQLHSKITEMEMELSEHSLVIGAIKELDPDRKCYRMIGGVLVERTVAEVLPAVTRNRDGLQEVITRLNEALEKKKTELAEFEAKYKIKIRRGGAEERAAEQDKAREGAAQGVLVRPAASS